ncbi:MAG: DUF4055 domain-containing protein [Gemmatimonadetes bacterium]|nr:DUF4055 domain-containing protein [Gemmatimonadota bacterium]
MIGWQLLEVTPRRVVSEVARGLYRNQTEIPLAEIVTSGRKSIFDSTPPLLDLALLNIAHYQAWSDQATSIHMTNVPILFMAGFGKDDGPVVIGANAAVTSENPDAKLAYISHDGRALDSSRQALEDIKSDMGTLGIAMLAPQKRAAETAEAKRLDKATSDSKLGTAARGLQDGLERALGFHARYLKLEDGGSIEINRDFEGLLLDAPVMTAYAKLAEAGFPRSSPDLCVEVEDAPRHLRYAACSTSGFSSNDTST